MQEAVFAGPLRKAYDPDGADEQDDRVSPLEQMRDSLRQRVDRRCWLVELAVEIVQ